MSNDGPSYPSSSQVRWSEYTSTTAVERTSSKNGVPSMADSSAPSAKAAAPSSIVFADSRSADAVSASLSATRR